MHTNTHQTHRAASHEDADDVAGFTTLPPHLRSELGGVFPGLLTGGAPRLLPLATLAGRVSIPADVLRRLLEQ